MPSFYNKNDWDESHASLGYSDRNGQGRSLKERDYFDPAIAARHKTGIDYQDKTGVRFSEKRRSTRHFSVDEHLQAKTSRPKSRQHAEMSWDGRWHVFGQMANSDNRNLNPNCRHYFSRPGLETSYRVRELPSPARDWTPRGEATSIFAPNSSYFKAEGGSSSSIMNQGSESPLYRALQSKLAENTSTYSQQGKNSSRSLSILKPRGKKKPSWDMSFATRPESRLNVFRDPNTRVYFGALPTRYSKEWFQGDDSRYTSQYAPKANPYVPRRTRSLDKALPMEGSFTVTTTPGDSSSSSPEDDSTLGGGQTDISRFEDSRSVLVTTPPTTAGQQGTSTSNPYMRKKKSNQMDRSRSEGFGEPHWHVHGLLSNDNPRLHPNNRHYFSRPGLAAGYRQRGISR